MIKRRAVLSIISLCLTMLLLTSVVFAAGQEKPSTDSPLKNFELNENEKLIFERNEITDEDQLLQRAKDGINEGNTAPKATVELSRNGKPVSDNRIETYVTVQKLKSKKNLITGAVSTLYRQDAFALIPAGVLRAPLDDPNSGYDESVSVKATNTIYYYQNYFDGRNVFKYDKVGGKWTRLDPTVSWSNSEIGWSARGTIYDNYGNDIGQISNSDRETVPSSGSPTSGTEYFMTPSVTNYIGWALTVDYMAGNQLIDLSRDGETWYFWFANYLDGFVS